MSRTWPTNPRCREPATWHVAWVLVPRGHFALVCDSHMEGLKRVYDYVDRHPAHRHDRNSRPTEGNIMMTTERATVRVLLFGDQSEIVADVPAGERAEPERYPAAEIAAAVGLPVSDLRDGPRHLAALSGVRWPGALEWAGVPGGRTPPASRAARANPCAREG
ncbi:hypothetical protein [Streptomyces murinus]